MDLYAEDVETMPRLARWRIKSFPSSNYIVSNRFHIGKWKWIITLQKCQKIYIKLYLESTAEDSLPIASFNIRVVSFLPGHKTLIHPGITDILMKKEDFYWELEDSFTKGRFIIDVEFLDLKISSPNGGEPRSIWSDGFTQRDTCSESLSYLAKMLSESICTDITICASNGSLEAHRAVLAASSPVFHSMFSHDLKEKETSKINISDMSIEACKFFVNYIYSNLQYQDFINHRLDLLIVADKYDISDLKNMCEESLIEDLNTKNVLERLQSASMYQLPKLKLSCIKYLVNFGRISDIREEFDEFMSHADRKLVCEVMNEVLSALK